MPRSEFLVRLVVVLSLCLTSFPPPLTSAHSASRPAYQTQEPAATPTTEPTATETTAPPTDTPPPPTDTPPPPTDTPLPPTDTSTPVSTDTPTTAPPAETSTPPPIDTPSPEPSLSQTPGPSETVPATETPTLTATLEVTLTPTEVLTATPTLTPTETVTPTLTPGPALLNLAMVVDPPFVNAGELVTVTLTLSNPGQIRLENLTISSTLPTELGYDTPLGAVIPGYNPLVRLLTWQIPPDLTAQPVLALGFVGRIAADAPANALSLLAEISQPGVAGSTQAQASLIILALPTPTPTATATPFPVGPPASIQLGVEPGPGERNGEQRQRWLTAYVLDADGLAVADGTEVHLSAQGGALAETSLRTQNGVVTTRLIARPNDTVSILAQAGQAQGSLQLGSGQSLANNILADLGLNGWPNGPAAALAAARNALRAEGDNWIADNFTRRVAFQPDGLTFILKGDRDTNRHNALNFRLTDLWVGQTSLLSGTPERRPSGNWLAYRPPSGSWQAIYEVGEASVEQYFLFEKGTPTDGDLVIEGQFQTPLQPELISDDEGIRFGRPGNQDEAAALGYGPALVSDAAGRQMTARLDLQGKRLRIIIPAAWLAGAEFPVVVDPLIGPAALVSGLSSSISDPAVASDGTGEFLSVWSWQGDIYGQVADSDGTLSGSLITISQASGVQETPDVVYNPTNDQYLVVWNDHRYGFTYNTLRAQRLSATGQLLGSELEVLSPTANASGPNLAASTAGNYLIAWSDQSSGSIDVYGQMVNSSGVLSGTRLMLSNATSTQETPDVAYDSQTDRFEVVWSDKRDGTYDIYGQQVTASGVISGSNQRLAGSGDSKDLTGPAVAANGSGQFLVAWQREVASGNHDVHAQRVTASTGLALGGTITLDNESGSKENSPALAGTSSGEYLVLWRDDGVIEARRVASDGSLPGSVLTLSEPTSGARNFPAVAHGNGQSLGVWTDTSQAGQTTLTGRPVSDGGAITGNEIFISPYYSRRERVASASSTSSAETLLAWDQAAASPAPDIFLQRLDGQGQPLGNPANLTNHPASQAFAALAAGQNGYLSVWRDSRNEASSGYDIYGQLLTSSAAPTGSLVAISTAALTQTHPAVAYNSQQDNYLVVWDDNHAGNNVDIYGQVVNSSGALGGSFSLSVTASQDYPDVAYNPDQNNYLAVWEDNRTSGSDDIYGQVISADGSLIGSSFAVAAASSNQYDPVVAYHQASQTYLVAWWDNRNGNYDIYGQIISGTGVLSGTNFPISNPGGTGNHQEYPEVVALPGGSPGQFLLVWQDKRSGDWDIYGQRVSSAGLLLDETDTIADETSPTNNFVFDNGGDYTELPVVAYNSTAAIALAAWNNRADGGVYLRRYTPTTPPAGTAAFNAAPTSGVVPLTVTFTDTSTGTIADRTWNFGDGITTTMTSSAPLSHTYLTTGTFTVALTVTHPGGSVMTSTLITVTEQTTPNLTADFESLDLAVDPTFWVDQHADTTSRDDFETLWAGDSRAYGTVYSNTNNTVYSHYAIPGWAAWQNYDYTGRLKMSDASGGIGLSFYSRYPAGQQKTYVLRRYAGTAETESFHLTAFGTSLKGDTQLEFTPQANTWYRFRVQAVTLANRVTLRARVWPDGQAEPTTWQADAYDDSASRSTAGAMGVRTFGPGNKYFDDLVVTPLSIQADFTVSAQSGLAPFTPTFTATPLGTVLTYTWNFGDGSALLASSIVTASHTYSEAGSYSVSLTVQGLAGSDTLTRPGYIVASDLNTGLRGYWKLDESGGLRLDSSPYGNHLTQTNTVSYTAGKVGQAADLERSNSQSLSISHTLQNGLGITGSLTLAGWVKLESLNPSGYMVIASKYEYGVNNRAYRLDLQSNGKLDWIVSSDGTYDTNLHELISTTPLTTGTWYHLGAVFDTQAQSLSLYVNGSLAATRAISFSSIYPSTAPFMLGANLNNGSATQFYDGLLDEWRVYARALGQAEMQALQATTPPTVTFSANPLTGTVPLTVSFSNTTSDPATFLWNFGDGITSTLINPTHPYTQPGVYTVSLTAVGAGGPTTLTKTNYITASPAGMVVDFSAFPLSGPMPLLVQFLNNTSGASSYAWSFGDGITSTLSSPTHTYTAVGVYTVTLSASNGTVSDTLTRTNYLTVTSPFTQNWTLITPTVSPPIIGEHSMAHDSFRSRVVLYGGNGAGWPYASTTWEFDGSNWFTMTTAVSPTARYGAAMAYDSVRQVMILFGGSDANDLALNQTWQYTNSTWGQVTITGSVPASRTYASMAAGPNGQIYLYGGNSSGSYSNDLWQYDNGAWTQIPITGTVPAARTLAAMTYDSPNNRLLLFGGKSVTGTILADLWMLSPITATTWTQLNPSGGPPGRMAHSLTYNSATNSVVLAAGTTNNGDTLLGDIWHYYQNGWTQVYPTTPLPPRAYHQTVYGNNTIILFSNGEVWKYE